MDTTRSTTHEDTDGISSTPEGTDGMSSTLEGMAAMEGMEGMAAILEHKCNEPHLRQVINQVGCMVYGVGCTVYGVWCMVYGVWCTVLGTTCGGCGQCCSLTSILYPPDDPSLRQPPIHVPYPYTYHRHAPSPYTYHRCGTVLLWYCYGTAMVSTVGNGCRGGDCIMPSHKYRYLNLDE